MNRREPKYLLGTRFNIKGIEYSVIGWNKITTIDGKTYQYTLQRFNIPIQILRGRIYLMEKELYGKTKKANQKTNY